MRDILLAILVVLDMLVVAYFAIYMIVNLGCC